MPNLKYLDTDNNKLKELEYDELLKLLHLNLSYNQIEIIDLTKIPNLTYLNLSNNELSFLDLSACINLKYLKLSNNKIKEKLDLSKFSSLTSVDISNNKINEIILPSCINNLNISNNNIKNIQLYNNIEKLYTALNPMNKKILSRKRMYLFSENPTKGTVEDGLCESKVGTPKGLAKIKSFALDGLPSKKDIQKDLKEMCVKCKKYINSIDLINYREFINFNKYNESIKYISLTCC